jgi:thiamine-phosphate pyrophosphorylase
LIYALYDFELLRKKNISLEQFLKLVLNNPSTHIHYKDNLNSYAIQVNNIKYLKKNCDIPIIIHDNLKLLDYCDGIHMEQNYFTSLKEEIFKINDNKIILKFLRKKYPSKIFGLSTKNELEILESNNLDIDYLDFGQYADNDNKNIASIKINKFLYLTKISKHPIASKCQYLLEKLQLIV